jgi:predicted MFS family arabinose efflux permease
MAIGTIAHYTLVPNISAYLQFNRGYPRDRLGLIYMIGGGFVFGTIRIAGWLTDRYAAPSIALFGTMLYATVLIVGIIYPVDEIPVIVVFIGFMISSSFRFVPMRALMSRVPGSAERARFLSVESAVDCAAAAIGAMLGPQILSEQPDHSLAGVGELALLAIGMTFVYCALCYAIEHRVRAHVVESARPVSVGSD